MTGRTRRRPLLLALGVFVALVHGCDRDREIASVVAALDESDCPAWATNHIVGGDLTDDVLDGTPMSDCILGYGGDDTITGGNGDDFIVGGEGNDVIDGGNGADTIYGDDGDDTIAGSNGRDTINGGDGNDIITGNNGPDDALVGGLGNDVILDGNGPATTIDGGGGPGDACDGTECELPAVSPCAVDGDCATGQRCQGGACIYCLSDSEVDDGYACNGVETCIPALGPQDGVDAPAGFDLGGVCTACDLPGTFRCDGIGGDRCGPAPGFGLPDDDCDGRDDDCDGMFDEAFPLTGFPIVCGVGACERSGSTICPVAFPGTPRGPRDFCAPGPATDEVCNTADDDCDGEIDEGLSRAITCAGMSCELGIEYCDDGVLTNLCMNDDEIADCRDNDCDGLVDEGFFPIEVCDGRDQDCDGSVDETGDDSTTTDQDHDGLCDNPVPGALAGTLGRGVDVCPFHPDAVALNPGSDFIVGTMMVASVASTRALPLQSFTVHTALGDVQTDCLGRYVYALPPGDTSSVVAEPFHMTFVVWGRVPGPEVLAGDGPISSVMMVTDDLRRAWGSAPIHGCCDDGFGRWADSTIRAFPDGHRRRLVSPITLNTSDAENHRVGVMVVDDYLRAVRHPVPNGNVEYMRRSGWEVGLLYVLYDYFEMPGNVHTRSHWATPLDREQLLFHESGHIFRHVADGNRGHWDGDLLRFTLGRCHQGTEVFAEGYAFNEGWADYWEAARHSGFPELPSNPSDGTAIPLVGTVVRDPGIDLLSFGPFSPIVPRIVTDYCDGTVGLEGTPLNARHMDWVERLVEERLLWLSTACFPTLPADERDGMMMQVLVRNPGRIHRLWEFEQELARMLSDLGLPACSDIRTTPPAPCPPGFAASDFATCRQWTGTAQHLIPRP